MVFFFSLKFSLKYNWQLKAKKFWYGRSTCIMLSKDRLWPFKYSFYLNPVPSTKEKLIQIKAEKGERGKYKWVVGRFQTNYVDNNSK
jgi:hypothetical protein